MESNANPGAGAASNPGTGAAPTNPPPQSGITPEQLHAAVEKARLEERDKLRTQIEENRTKAEKAFADLAAANKKVEELTAQVTQITDQFTALKNSVKPEGGVDVAKAIETAVQAAATRIGENYNGQIAELKTQLEQERSARSQLTLEQLKAKLVQEAGGASALIPELVTGSNEEELKKSIDYSKQIFARTVGSVNPGASNSNSNGTSGAGNIPTNPPALPQSGATNPGMAPRTGQRMSPAEYAKQRDQLRASVAGRYPSNYVRQ